MQHCPVGGSTVIIGADIRKGACMSTRGGVSLLAGPALCLLLAAAPAQSAPSFDQIVSLLASDSFAQREAGQRQLDRVDPSAIDQLQQFAAAQSDPEIRARLEARMVQMEVFLALHPPTLSL